MKKYSLYVLLILVAILGYVTPARAQAVEELTLSVSRDFGSSFGKGDIQGKFSLKATGPSNLVRVQFYIDNTILAEETDSPFMVQFVTDDYAPGKHTMYAMGTTSDGRELHSRELTFNYINAVESRQRVLIVLVPILAFVLIRVLFSNKVTSTLSRGHKKGDLVPPGGHGYGVSGGTICPRCAHPFALNFFSPHLLVWKLARCPNCGKWFIRRAQ